MSVEHRRSNRIADYFPLVVHSVAGSDGPVIAGPFSGRIIDISSHGACLLMTQIFRDGFHLFHTTRDTEGALLQLTIEHPPEITHYLLTALPVWLGLFRQDEIRAFKMGIEFTENPEKAQMKALRQVLEKNQEERGGWWLKHCKFWK